MIRFLKKYFFLGLFDIRVLKIFKGFNGLNLKLFHPIHRKKPYNLLWGMTKCHLKGLKHKKYPRILQFGISKENIHVANEFGLIKVKIVKKVLVNITFASVWIFIYF